MLDDSSSEHDNPTTQSALAGEIAASAQVLAALKQHITAVVVGQNTVANEILVALIANGHVLVEGVPGLGKTLLVRTLASCFAGAFKRIQFTPDLMPADVTGHTLYDAQEAKFKIRRGPVFTNILLADEINRAPAKTQAALLEVMQEKQVTIEGTALSLPNPFFVFATQNPLEQEGTYPLPEAELDRFLFKLYIDYPSEQAEQDIARSVVKGQVDANLDQLLHSPPFTEDTIIGLQGVAQQLTVADSIIDYAVRIVRATRHNMMIESGAGPRASIGLLTAARAVALIEGRDFVLPDDVKSIALPVLRHRVQITADTEIEGKSVDQVLGQLLDSIEAPRL